VTSDAPASGKLANVKDEVRSLVSQDTLAAELSTALDGLFEITSYRRFKAYNGSYVGMYAKPTKTIRGSLVVEREVFVLIANYAAIHARTITVCQEAIRSEQPRLQPALAILVHADPDGDANLRAWGREAGLTVLPIYRPGAGAMPPAAVVRQRLARELFATDSFQVTGPVSDDSDFFGRREQANDLLRQLQAGRIAALFGLRKVGKTSMLNRVIDLASMAGSPKVAMIDCSLRGFNELGATDALKAVARLARLASQQGYAHVSQTVGRSDSDIMSTFDALWSSEAAKPPLLIVFDEVDYITPDSPTSPHWKGEFNEFWREFRALVQESKRHDLSLSVLVSGVSSRSFRAAEINGVENSVLHFVPEDYLTPFAEAAADAMINALAKRCGLTLPRDARGILAQTSAYLPYWMRMAGSYVHRHVEVEGRPVEIDARKISQLCEEFAETEGAEISRVALQNLKRVDKPMFDLLVRVAGGETVDSRQARPLIKYGLVKERAGAITVDSIMVRRGLDLLRSQEAHPGVDEAGEVTASRKGLELDEGEWAEELASINRRRNILERKAREFVRVVLKMTLPAGKDWVGVVNNALSSRRREECAGLAPDALMSKLYWIELSAIIGREWVHFERFFQDKKRLQNAFTLLNERPDAHAKDVDLADVALQRKELTWLEERIAQ
jgi:hypothetical protein